MSDWSIQPAEVNTVLVNVADHIGDEEGTGGLIGEGVSLGEALQEMDTAAGSVPISVALGEFAAHYFGLFGDAVGLSVSAVSGAAEATGHYVDGDLEMAAEAQATASTIPDSVN
ncbi:DUF6507 family protein [Nocardiopsis exhalans]|uniref:DUF6507 family protein n=1 Tax=Nocardiopsis exhalans TaxID=163604 RepID=A0ABY5CZV2_9ACTN|nr:DUF6507 family protein [Nocardiopsis exhalans]USY17477.1 DUF6507 family protein [Nocardiopsis exhalans]